MIKNSTLFFYGILGVPIAFLGFPLYIYLPTFYVEHVGLSVGLVGFILLILPTLSLMKCFHVLIFTGLLLTRKAA